jgi:hypothetical protein
LLEQAGMKEDARRSEVILTNSEMAPIASW